MTWSGKTANKNRPNSKRKDLISGDGAFHGVLHEISEQCLPFIFLITNESLAYVLPMYIISLIFTFSMALFFYRGSFVRKSKEVRT